MLPFNLDMVFVIPAPIRTHVRPRAVWIEWLGEVEAVPGFVLLSPGGALAEDDKVFAFSRNDRLYHV